MSDFEERNGRMTCRKCGYEMSAMASDDSIPERCPAHNEPVKLTVICREEGFESSILIYVVEVHDPNDHAAVTAAVQAEREHDVDEPNTMEILFAFDGDLSPSHDWRD